MKLEPGGRAGGEVTFLIGLLLSVVGLYLFFDSVRITSGHGGLISNLVGGRGRHGGGGASGLGQTTSMGIVIVPLFIGIVALFFDAKKTWAWVLTWAGIGILIIEIVSRFRPHFDVKASHAIIMLVMIAGGLGMMLRGYIVDKNSKSGE